jgi:acetyl esterase/lipase
LSKRAIFGISTVLIVALLGAVVYVTAASHRMFDVEKLSDLSYVDGSKDYFQLLDLFLPKRSDQKTSPVIVWIHGGAWRYGDKKDTPAVAFAQRGYAVASLNYRLSDKAKFPAQIEDCKAAIRWLRAHAKEYNLDPNRFAAFGMSAGGHLVALLGVTNDNKEFDTGSNLQYSSNVQAVCDWCGPTDMLSIQKQAQGKTQLDWQGPKAPLKMLFGDQPDKVPDLARKASPINFVKAGDPPFLIMHGDKDDVVPFEQSQELYDALKKANVDVQLVTVKDAGHSFCSADTLIQTVNFLDQKLK